MADSKKYNGSTWEHSLRKLVTATDTLTTLPVDLYADGNNATVGLKGNTVQSGTPTPDSPIMPQGTGERTGNLFDGEYPNIDFTLRYRALNLGNGTYTLSSTVEIAQGSAGTLFLLAGNVSSGASTATNAVYKDRPITVTAIDGYVTIAYRVYATDTPVGKETMLNEGSTARPFEPYGVKIPISSASTTTPVYLGEVESTRRIKKLVLTGEENITSGHLDVCLFNIPIDDYIREPIISLICTHYKPTQNVLEWGYVPDKNICFYVGIIVEFRQLYIRDSSYSTIADFKAYLAAQYSAGTPVTIWYVLATEETAVVNEPLMKIGDYADTVSGITIPTITGKDTFDVETTLKPSEVTVNYKGWHPVQSVHERESGQWN